MPCMRMQRFLSACAFDSQAHVLLSSAASPFIPFAGYGDRSGYGYDSRGGYGGGSAHCSVMPTSCSCAVLRLAWCICGACHLPLPVPGSVLLCHSYWSPALHGPSCSLRCSRRLWR